MPKLYIARYEFELIILVQDGEDPANVADRHAHDEFHDRTAWDCRDGEPDEITHIDDVPSEWRDSLPRGPRKGPDHTVAEWLEQIQEQERPKRCVAAEGAGDAGV